MAKIDMAVDAGETAWHAGGIAVSFAAGDTTTNNGTLRQFIGPLVLYASVVAAAVMTVIALMPADDRVGVSTSHDETAAGPLSKIMVSTAASG